MRCRVRWPPEHQPCCNLQVHCSTPCLHPRSGACKPFFHTRRQVPSYQMCPTQVVALTSGGILQLEPAANVKASRRAVARIQHAICGVFPIILLILSKSSSSSSSNSSTLSRACQVEVCSLSQRLLVQRWGVQGVSHIAPLHLPSLMEGLTGGQSAAGLEDSPGAIGSQVRLHLACTGSIVSGVANDIACFNAGSIACKYDRRSPCHLLTTPSRQPFAARSRPPLPAPCRTAPCPCCCAAWWRL